MPHPIRRRTLIRAGLALSTSAAAWSIVAPARACEFFAASLRITHPWTRATGPGDTSARICMRFDEVTQTDRLIGAETPVARGAVTGGVGGGGPLAVVIAAGRTTELSESGVHLRLTGLRHPLAYGRTYPLTLRFEHGGEVAASFDVDYERADGAD